MTENEKDQYIELQRQYIQISLKRGHTMQELEVLKRIEEFECNLPCNKETEVYINGKINPL